MDIVQLDVQMAYLQSPVEEDVYVNPVPGYGTHGKAMKLNKSLYGLRQSGKNWFETIDYSLTNIAFVPTWSDPCVYMSTGQTTSWS